MKQYELSIQVQDVSINYYDSVEAHNKQEAALKFAKRMPDELRVDGWADPIILEHYIRILP